MRVTKEQARANRERVVATASTLFRERGFDGIGVADLMASAGLTHGGFYKNFRSKAALMRESAASGFEQLSTYVADLDIPRFVDYYVSRTHRDSRAGGCTMAALAGDAARQPDEIKTVFEAGIETMVAILQRAAGDETDPASRARAISVLAEGVGAIVLSRACTDASELSDEILDVCHSAMQSRGA
ncbi:MAG: TetR/AcrR family transcriptional regulator [Comamonadaceae bacterium]|nr:MAG: TetR/AcrR family transcriptional regulator [Comamonadaceae bacterium]